jgi:hypothetical protein
LEREKSIAEEELVKAPPRDPSNTNPVAEVDIALEAEEMRRDREQLEELDLEPSNSQEPLEKSSKPGGDRDTKAPVAPVAPAQAENSEVAIRYDPGSATVNAQDKRTGTDGRSVISPVVDTNGRQPVAPRGDTNIPQNSLKAASLLANKLLGDTTRTRGADVDSGSYRGPIIAETADLFLQHLSTSGVVAHPKELLDQSAGLIGSNVRINYAHGKPTVRPVKERPRAREIGR